jgi:hypothetical protein
MSLQAYDIYGQGILCLALNCSASRSLLRNTNFGAIEMVSVNGSDRHTHSITNFTGNIVAVLILDIHGTTFTGESDIITEGNVTWHAKQTTVDHSRT